MDNCFQCFKQNLSKDFSLMESKNKYKLIEIMEEQNKDTNKLKIVKIHNPEIYSYSSIFSFSLDKEIIKYDFAKENSKIYKVRPFSFIKNGISKVVDGIVVVLIEFYCFLKEIQVLN